MDLKLVGILSAIGLTWLAPSLVLAQDANAEDIEVVEEEEASSTPPKETAAAD